MLQYRTWWIKHQKIKYELSKINFYEYYDKIKFV